MIQFNRAQVTLAQGLTGTSPGWYAQLVGDTVPRVRVGLNSSDVASIGFGSGSGTRDAFIERVGAASLRFGAGAVDTAPVAQTLSVQNTLAGGTSNVAGADFTIAGSQGKGTGVGGSLIFQVAPAGSTGTTVNALVTALTVDSTKLASFAGNVNLVAQSSILTLGSTDGSSSVSVRYLSGTNSMQLRIGRAGSASDLIIGNSVNEMARIQFVSGGGNMVLTGGAYTSGAPNGGTAGAWKLGALVTKTSVYDTTRYIQLDVGGVLYPVALCVAT